MNSFSEMCPQSEKNFPGGMHKTYVRFLNFFITISVLASGSS